MSNPLTFYHIGQRGAFLGCKNVAPYGILIIDNFLVKFSVA